MNLKIVEGPQIVINPAGASYVVNIDGECYSCFISEQALLDDYRQPGYADRIEVFHDHIDDVLRRTKQKILASEANEGDPHCIKVLSGDFVLL